MLQKKKKEEVDNIYTKPGQIKKLVYTKESYYLREKNKKTKTKNKTNQNNRGILYLKKDYYMFERSI